MTIQEAERAAQWSQAYSDKHYPDLKMTWESGFVDGENFLGYSRPTKEGEMKAAYTIDSPVTKKRTEYAAQRQIEMVVQK